MREIGIAIYMFLIALSFMLVMTFMLTHDGRVTFSYKADLDICKADYKALEEAQKPVCAPVEVKQGNSGIVWGILGMLLYIGGLFFFWKQPGEKQKLQDELTKAKEELAVFKAVKPKSK